MNANNSSKFLAAASAAAAVALGALAARAAWKYAKRKGAVPRLPRLVLRPHPPGSLPFAIPTPEGMLEPLFFKPIRTIMQGGSLTSRVQQALTNAGFSTQGVDGDWGSHTAFAVQAFQRSRGWTPTGLPEPEVLQALGIAVPPLTGFPFLGPNIVPVLVGLKGIAVGIMDPVKLMLSESGMRPTAEAKDKTTGKPVASGVFQLLVTNSNFGPGSFTGMTLAQWKGLTADQQIPFAARFWRQKGLPMPLSVRNLYWSNFLPAAVVPNAPDSYPFVFADDTYASARGSRISYHGVYTMNLVLDHPLPGTTTKKGYITAGDMSLAADGGARSNPELYAALAAALTPYASTNPPPAPSSRPLGIV